MRTTTSVVVATWQRPAQLERCLAALLRQERAADEILVVARPDDEPTHAALAGVDAPEAHIRTVPVTVPGVVAALNAGIAAARGEIVAFTDDDAAPAADWLRGLVGHFEQGPDLGAVGGRDDLAGYDDPPVASDVVGKVRWYGRAVGEHHRGVGAAERTDVLKGVNMAFRHSALEPIGIDPLLRGTGAQPHWEMAVCLAIKRAGWGILYDPAVAVDHDEGPRFGAAKRGFGDASELAAAAHNRTYAMIRWLPPWRKPVVLAYELLVGSRIAPGVITAVERGLRTSQWRQVLGRLRAATRGRVEAVGTYIGVLRNRS